MDTLKNAKAKLASANKDIVGFISAFVDEHSFVETDAFVCSENPVGEAVGEGVVTGFATINDKSVCLFVTNPKVLKGSIGERSAKKIVRLIKNAIAMRKPLIAVWDTAGARFAEGIAALEGYGSILRAYTEAISKKSIPVITVVKGNNLGISSYTAGLSDFVIAYENSVIATASPLVLAAKTGESEKIVGTAKRALQGGIADITVKSDKELRDNLTKIFNIIYNKAEYGDDLNRVCKGLKAGVSPRTVINEVIDKNSFLEMMSEYAPEVITGFASLGDTAVGVIATDSSKSEGRLTVCACDKIRVFLTHCEDMERPVVIFTDCVGTARSADDAALIREMSGLLYWINTMDISLFSVVYGKAIGSAYTALVSPCDYKIAWECAEVGALESEAAARLLYADEIKSAKDKDKVAQKLAKEYGGENNGALAVAAGGYFDNVIEPNHTRSYLLAALLAHTE